MSVHTYLTAEIESDGDQSTQARRSRTVCGRTILACLLVLSVSSVSSACYGQSDDVQRHTRITAEQLQKLANDASRSAKIPTELQGRLIRERAFFDVTFGPNSDATRWAIVIHADSRTARQQHRALTAAGFQQSLQSTIPTRQGPAVTTVWIRPSKPDEPLTRPETRIPITGWSIAGFEPMDEMLVNFLRRHNVAGVSVTIAQHGTVVYQRGVGFADTETEEAIVPDNQLRIASLSKPVTAVAILKLVEDGKLSLDDPVVPILQRLQIKLPDKADPRWNDITIRHLLQHQGGWDRTTEGDPMFQVSEFSKSLGVRTTIGVRTIIQQKMKDRLTFDPGRQTTYSNFGYAILGRIIEEATGNSYEQAVNDLVLAPAGMKQTELGRTRWQDRTDSEVRYHMQTAKHFTPYWAGFTDFGAVTLGGPDDVTEPYGRWKLEVMDAHGGWISTAGDLVKFVSMLQQDDAPLLNAETIRHMIASPPFTEDAPGSVVWTGLGWSVRCTSYPEIPTSLKDCNLWHHGALAGTSTLLVHRSDGYSWAVLFNTDRSKEGPRLSNLIDPLMHTTLQQVQDSLNR